MMFTTERANVIIDVRGVAIHKKEDRETNTSALDEWIKVIRQPAVKQLRIHPAGFTEAVEPIVRSTVEPSRGRQVLPILLPGYTTKGGQ